MTTKIAIIGGGSAYAPGLINAFIRNSDIFSGSELALMDINSDNLDIVHRLGSHMVNNARVDLKISATTNRKAAISDADYIITSFRQGGFEARHQDESIPLKHNILGQETIGPGGFFFAMRTLPVIKAITTEISKFAPRAVLINYTNPTQIVAEAVNHFTDIPIISICDQSDDDLQNILVALEIKTPSEVIYESIGLNHATWSSHFQVNGQNGIELMCEACDTVLARTDLSKRVKRQFQLTREFGLIPNSYLQHYYYREETIAEAIASPHTRAQQIMASLPDYYSHFLQELSAPTPKLTKVRGGSLFGDMAVDVIRSLLTGNGEIHTLNVKNRNALPGFDPDRIVELPCHLDRSGATPLAQKHLPHSVMGILSMLSEYQWLAANAIWKGTRKDAVKALSANPLILSLTLAETLLDEITPLQGNYYPERLLVNL
ncbi:MAG: hypothetical protein JEZ06_15850 [Anaerolineaceae bacterium]|nr:hypothetical protein [Anaerolineaceae bacterium]